MTRASLLLLLLPTFAHAPPALADSIADTYHERRVAGTRARVEAANRVFAQARESGVPGPLTALVSLSSRVTIDALLGEVARCGAQALAMDRTVGEMQFSFGVEGTVETTRAQIAAQLAQSLGDRIGEIEAERPTAPPEQSRWSEQAHRSYSAALAELSNSRVTVNGVLVRGTLAQADCLRAGLPVLAIEVLRGSQRPFAIPLEFYR